MVTIERWSAEHPRFADLLDCVKSEGQTQWVDGEYARSFAERHFLVAVTPHGEVVGFLLFIQKPIGPEEDCDAAELDGVLLIEAKILAFGVREDSRQQGIGTALQHAAIQWARELGCYQLRSWSESKYGANHSLKQRLGFAIVPELRTNGQQGVYFILPLMAFDLLRQRAGEEGNG